MIIRRYPLLHGRVRWWGEGAVRSDDLQVCLRGRPLRRRQGGFEDQPPGLLRQWAGEDHKEVHSRARQEGLHWWVFLLLWFYTEKSQEQSKFTMKKLQNITGITTLPKST